MRYEDACRYFDAKVHQFEQLERKKQAWLDVRLVWSVAEGLGVVGHSDIDFEIVTNDIAATLKDFVSHLLLCMWCLPRIKKYTLNNFYADYTDLRSHKQSTMWTSWLTFDNRFWLCQIVWFDDDSLTSSTLYDVIITETQSRIPDAIVWEFQESQNNKKNDMSLFYLLKVYVYTTYPNFWHRWYMVRNAFVSWVRTQQDMDVYLSRHNRKQLKK